MAVCVVEPVFIAKQIHQFAIKPKQGIVPTERGRDFEGYLVMVNRFLGIALGFIYRAENTVGFADLRLFAFLRKEIDRAGCGLFSPGARHDSPGKVIIKYFLIFFTMESRYNFHN